MLRSETVNASISGTKSEAAAHLGHKAGCSISRVLIAIITHSGRDAKKEVSSPECAHPRGAQPVQPRAPWYLGICWRCPSLIAYQRAEEWPSEFNGLAGLATEKLSNFIQ